MATSKVLSADEERYLKQQFAILRRMKDRYTYEGMVVYDNYICQKYWCAATYAVSAEKAKSNLMYQYKLEHGLPINAKIDLPGILTIG